MEKDNFITSYGFIATIIVTVVGIGIFSYPREIASMVEGDVWLVTIVAGGINLILLKLLVRAVKVNGFQSVTDVIKARFGSMLGGLILIIMCLSTLFSVSLGLRAFIEVVKMYLLTKTPTEFLLVVTILTGVYIVRGGVSTNVKFNEITLWIMFIPAVIIVLFTFKQADYTNILPAFRQEVKSYIYALPVASFAFTGAEVVYMMLPMLRNKKSAIKGIRYSMIFITFFYIVVSITSIAVLTTSQTKQLLWPAIDLIRSIEIPGAFVERWDGVVMSLWIIYFFTTFSNGYTFSAYILSDALPLRDIRLSALIIAPFVYIIALLPTNLTQLYSTINIIAPFNYIINLLIIPLLLIMFGKSKNYSTRGEER